MVEIDDLITDLSRSMRRSDRQTLKDRVAREMILIENPTGGEHGMLVRGQLCAACLHDAKIAFVHGLWIPSMLACLAAIEHHIGATLYGSGDDFAPAMTFQQKVSALRAVKLLNEAEAVELNDLHALIAVYRDFHPPVTFMRRQVESTDVMATDAHKALAVTARFFFRHCAI